MTSAKCGADSPLDSHHRTRASATGKREHSRLHLIIIEDVTDHRTPHTPSTRHLIIWPDACAAVSGGLQRRRAGAIENLDLHLSLELEWAAVVVADGDCAGDVEEVELPVALDCHGNALARVRRSTCGSRSSIRG